jgi:hypothetical protein
LSVTLVSFNAVAQSRPMSAEIEVNERDRDLAVKATVVRFDDLNLSKKAAAQQIAAADAATPHSSG